MEEVEHSVEHYRLVRQAFELFFERLPKQEMDLLCTLLDRIPKRQANALDHFASEWLELLRGLLSAFRAASPLFDRAYHCESVGDDQGLAQALLRISEATERIKIWHHATNPSPVRGALVRSGRWIRDHWYMDPLEEQGIIQVIASDGSEDAVEEEVSTDGSWSDHDDEKGDDGWDGWDGWDEWSDDGDGGPKGRGPRSRPR